jgi:exodeoxyribonuclease V alpha subunit
MNTLEGTVRRVTYYNTETGYTVLRLKPSSAVPAEYADAVDPTGLVTVVGIMPQIAAGELLEIEGQWRTHPDYGLQLQSVTVKRALPTTPKAIARYLRSKIRGVGKQTAAAIVDHFGKETLAVLDYEPERLYEIDGVGRHRVRQIIKGWQAQKDDQEVMLFLQGNGLPTTLAMRVYQAYGEETVAQVEEDPYRLSREIFGIGFKIADRFARSLGVLYNDPNRVRAGVEFALEQAVNEGHVYLPREELALQTAELLGLEVAAIQEAIDSAIRREMVISEQIPTAEEPFEAIYLPMYYYSELGIANRLRCMVELSGSRLERLQKLGLSAKIADTAAHHDVNLTPQQLQAIERAVLNKISILTGGPGTGKTTTLRTLIEVLRKGQHSFALASPTGRAAKRLSEATGYSASTIHRLLGYSAMGQFEADADNPLNYDMIILDETSMLDVILANALTRALDPRSHVVLVGDTDQLPSVGAGDVLSDLIASGEVPVTRLETIFRQGEGSMIIANAHRINSGQAPETSGEANDFFHFRIADDPDRAADLLVDVVANRIPEKFGFHPLDEVQVLVPMYRGPAGVNALNARLQEVLNPAGRTLERRFGDAIFRVGDKVIQTRNNYEKDVFNGDVGRIHAMDLEKKLMTVVYDNRFVEYEWADVVELMHAYAISVHRSQGSEYPAIVMPIITQHYMLLQRNLLYTAVTRAKGLAVLIGSDKAVNIAVRNDAVSRRYTALAPRLQGLL